MSTTAYDKSIFKQFFDSNDSDVIAWRDNLFDKLYKNGIVPVYVERGDDNNVDGEDDDYVAFWTGVAEFFAYYVIYARKFQTFDLNREMLFDYITNRGVGESPEGDIDEFTYLMRKLYDDTRMRGTTRVFDRVPNGDPKVFDSVFANDNVIHGEFVRAISYNYSDEYAVVMTDPSNFGWCAGRCSPMYRGTLQDYQLTKAYEATDYAVDKTKYPIKNTSNVSVFTDSSISKDVLKFVSTGSKQCGIGISGTSSTDPVVIWNVSATGSPSGILIKDITNTKTIGVANWTTDLSTTMNLLRDSINNNVANGSLFGGAPPFDNSDGYTAAWSGIFFGSAFDVVAPVGSGSAYNGVNLGMFVNGGSWSITPNQVRVFSGGADSTYTPEKLIVIDHAVNYETTFQCKSISGGKLDFSIKFFDEAFNLISSVKHIDGVASDGSIITAHPMWKDGQYYFVRGISFGVNEPLRSSANSMLDFGVGKHLQIPCGAKYMAPIVQLHSDSNPSAALYIYDFKVRIADTVYSRGFIQSPNIIQVWAKNNNGLYSRILQALISVINPISYHNVITIPLLEEFVERYLIPYNSTILFNWLSAESSCGVVSERSYDPSYNVSYD